MIKYRFRIAEQNLFPDINDGKNHAVLGGGMMMSYAIKAMTALGDIE